MEKVKVIIADDEINAINKVKNAIAKREDVIIVGEAKNGEEEIQLINSLNPDIVFTDNQMPKLNGIDVIESFVDKENSPFFIMISADTDMIKKSIQYNFRYFNKLNDYSKLCDIIDEYKNNKVENNEIERKNVNNKKKNFWRRIFD